MRNLVAKQESRGLIIVCVVLLALAVAPLLSSARSLTASTSVNIVNNSSWEIHHVYLQASDQEAWSTDQLNGSIIAPGGSYSLSNAACDGPTTKVITEDKDGCFLSSAVSCSGSTTWTITNAATPDCD
jgi:hypothetical protein